MKNYKGLELIAYADGIHAAHRIGKYGGYKTTPNNPYPEKSSEHNAWEDGFGDGTEDLIWWQRSDLE